MTRYIDKDAIAAEIERLKSIQLSIFSKGETEESCYKSLSCISVYNEVLSFLDTFEEPTNEDLEEAAYKASLNNFVDPECLDDDELRNFDWIKYYEQVFKTGALWQKQQDSIEKKEMDLEKEITQFLETYFPDARIGHKLSLRRTAKHFFELGLKAKGE